MKHLQIACSLWDEAVSLPHFWEHTFGSGHAPLALRGDWQQQLRARRMLLGFRHTRFHGLRCDEIGTLMCERNELLYSFFNADQICDFLLSIGIKPLVELSFMPSTLANGGKTGQVSFWHLKRRVSTESMICSFSTGRSTRGRR
ncbi:GH39 family glycosyl hydrolase [Variovorax sp. LG9.2]|uniref:GH39 family glycosyl hydrolase n=1 Tax=Variovorax sp. LG9.2 TaxID=3048626 RepID=UPI002B3BD821|nr:hypothetical protein [Variovorax sp. LG9.2]